MNAQLKEYQCKVTMGLPITITVAVFLLDGLQALVTFVEARRRVSIC
jgi:hypothetical protein